MSGRPRKVKLPSVTEKAFMAQVVALAAAFGYDHFHPFDSRRSDPGWPDLVLCRAAPYLPRLIFAELKKDGQEPTAAQVRWLDRLRQCGQEAYVWVPAELEVIATILQGDRP